MSTLDGIRQRMEAATTRTIANATFGDVLRIVWTTYYFGADQQWHNARSGELEDAAVLERERKAAGDDWAWLGATSDRDRLLAAVDAVLAETYASDDGSEWEHNDGCEGEPTCPACWAQDIRRAVNKAISA